MSAVDEQQMGEHTPKWAVKYAALIEQRDQLFAALDKYGWHEHKCAAISDHSADVRWPEVKCTCGFDAALALGNTK